MDKNDYVAELELFCDSEGYGKPEYLIVKVPPMILCSVTIKGVKYDSYPEEFIDEKSAYQRTAQITIESINIRKWHKEHPEARKKMGGKGFIDELHLELLKFPRGILGHRMEEWFGRTFGYPLPRNWKSQIKKSDKFRLKSVPSTFIVFPNDPGCPNSKKRNPR